MELTAALFREGLVLMATTGGPMFVALLLVGLAMGVLQAATQIQDPAVGFLPRIVAALAVCWFLGGWMVERFAHFLAGAMTQMAVHPF
jgi:flagellar biosynthesis protein FliQ